MFKTLLKQTVSNIFMCCRKQYASSLMQLQHVAFKSILNYFLILICINKVIFVCLFRKTSPDRFFSFRRSSSDHIQKVKDVPAPIVVKEILVCQSFQVSYNCHIMSINSSSRLCFLHQQQCQPLFFLPGSNRIAAIHLLCAAPAN